MENTQNTPTPRSSFRLYRSRDQRMLGGVCGGLAESLDVDVTLVRIGLVALTVLGGGIGIPLYIAAWIIAPERSADVGSSGVGAPSVAGAGVDPTPGVNGAGAGTEQGTGRVDIDAKA